MTERLAALRLQFMAGELAQQIGARIRQRRVELGLNQTQLAALIESDAVNNQRISDWERGVHKPSERYMEQLAGALQRDVSWLYAGDTADKTPDLLGALDSGGESQLDRIDQLLRDLVSRVAALELGAALDGEGAQHDEPTTPPVAAPSRKSRSRKAS